MQHQKLISLFFAISISLTVNAQFKIGLRGGGSVSQMNLTKAIDIVQEGDYDSKLNFATNTSFGLHLGAISQITLGSFFIQPEAIFHTTGQKITVNEIKQDEEYFSKIVEQRDYRLDIPVLAGVKLGPVRLGLGPVASIKLHTKDKIADAVDEALKENLTKVTFNDVTWSAQIGVGIDILELIAIDIRYEIGLTKISDGIKIEGVDYNFSEKANQIVFSVGLYL